jgi:hypothetical protein
MRKKEWMMRRRKKEERKIRGKMKKIEGKTI